jgi:hypothetical protein
MLTTLLLALALVGCSWRYDPAVDYEPAPGLYLLKAAHNSHDEGPPGTVDRTFAAALALGFHNLEVDVQMGLADAEDDGPRPLSSDEGERRILPGKVAARCWALLLARIFEYLPRVCPRCGEAMHVIAFILDPPVVERILGHIGEPTEAPAVLPARSPPQGELSFDVGVEEAGGEAWPEIDQTGGGDDGWG